MIKFCTILVILFVNPAFAAPVWETAEIVEGMTLYKDHQDDSIYYYQPVQYQLTERAGEPQLYYYLYRYLGTTETGDYDAFKVSGVLSVDIEQRGIAVQYMRARTALRQAQPHAVLRSVPVTAFNARLNYVGIDDNDKEVSGSIDATTANGIEGQTAAKNGGLWNKRQFTIGFEPLTAELFWKNFEEENLQISLSYGVLSSGKRKNTEGAWENDEREFGNSTGILVSMQEYPDHFVRTETWQQMKRRRTDVIVSCYDFFEDASEELYRVTVEIRFRTINDQDYIERLRFTDIDDETDRTVSFKLARSMEEPYFYRVTRLYKTRPTETTDWVEHNGLLLDITSYVL